MLMKKILTVFIFFTVIYVSNAQSVESISPSSLNQSNDLINNFLINEIKGRDIENLYLKQEPISQLSVIEMYEKAFKERSLHEGEYKQMIVSPADGFLPFDANAIKILKQESLKDTLKVWQEKDFELDNVIIKNRESLKQIDFLKNLGLKNYILHISKPIFSDNKEYALIGFYASTAFNRAPLPNQGVIIMEKRKGKWYPVSVINEEVYY